MSSRRAPTAQRARTSRRPARVRAAPANWATSVRPAARKCKSAVSCRGASNLRSLLESARYSRAAYGVGPHRGDAAAGRFADVLGLGACKACEPGRYCAPGSKKGLLCGRGSYCQQTSCYLYNGTCGAEEQTLCPAGRYGDATGLTNDSCSGECDTGHYCLAGAMSAQQFSCPAGTYSDSRGLKSAQGCAVCPPGTACPSGATAPTPCPAGRVAPLNKTKTECELCRTGTYQDEKGRTACASCEVGGYCSQGATTPTRCSAGRFSGQIGATSNETCSECSPGTSCGAGSTEEVPCGAGYYSNTNKSVECTQCSKGKFQSATGQTACTECPEGGFCKRRAASPTPCQAGTFGNVTGLTMQHECRRAAILPTS